ncbi:unnamed protein product [Ranitomeya imitator]|uniref:Growth hormone-inducible transmembrane protein n=1 Tax=Ranitomeya imitator TaxID=111125 RepID=A0ABN9LRX2_9NEOB|nr:unnamed protein product [Ranitomeya imitator]
MSVLEKRILRVWPEYVKDRIRSTYMYFAGSIGLTALSAVAVSRSPALMSLMMRGSWLLAVPGLVCAGPMMTSRSHDRDVTAGPCRTPVLGRERKLPLAMERSGERGEERERRRRAIGATFAAMIGAGMLVRSIPYDQSPGAKHLAWMLHSAQAYFACPVEVRAKYCSAQALGLSDLSRRTAVLCSAFNREDKVRLRRSRSVKTRRGRPPMKMGGPGLQRPSDRTACPGVMGAVVAPLTLLGGPLLIKAAWYTAGIVGGLSTVAMCAPSEKFLNMGAPLGIGLGLVLVSSIGSAFLPPTTVLGAGLYSVAVYGGLVLFGMFLLYDTQKVIKRAETTPMYGMVKYDPINASGAIVLLLLVPDSAPAQYALSGAILLKTLQCVFNKMAPESAYCAGADSGTRRRKTMAPELACMGIYTDTLNIFIRVAMMLAGGGGGRKK